jgi:hypothetical protein
LKPCACELYDIAILVPQTDIDKWAMHRPRPKPGKQRVTY